MYSLLLALAIVLPFELPEYLGHTYRSEDHPSSVFVIEAYFNACPYCNYNAQNVNDLAFEYPHVQVLDVGIDRKESDYAAWVKKHNPNHPVLMDGSRQLIRKLGTQSYPSTYVIDTQGQVVYETSGEWNSKQKKEIRSAIDAAVREVWN